MSTEDVLNHHLAAFEAGDVDETMEDFTEDSVMILPDATLRGMDSIRTAFTDFFGGLFKTGTFEFTMDRVEVVSTEPTATRLSAFTACPRCASSARRSPAACAG